MRPRFSLLFALSILLALPAVARAEQAECAAPQTCRPLCAAGNASACSWLGELYTDRMELSEDESSTSIGLRFYEDACTRGDARGCGELARALGRAASEAGRDPDDRRIAQLRARACKGGDWSACQGEPRVAAAAEKACAAGRAEACLDASLAYGFVLAADPNSPPDDEGGGRATAMALGERGRTPQRPRPNRAKAKALFDRGDKLVTAACAKRQARTCALADRFHPDQRPTLRERACQLGASRACGELTRAALIARDPRWVVTATAGCQLGDVFACRGLSASYQFGSNTLAVDRAKAAQFDQQGCDQHDGAACVALARREPDPAKALVLHERACAESASYACAVAADAYVARDLAKAISLYHRACEHETWDVAVVREVCGELAKRYDTGEGVAKNPDTARALRERGCRAARRPRC